MKPRSLPRSRNLLQLASAITALLACQAAQAALTWDGSDLVSTGAQGGSGNWNVNSTADWWNGTADVIWPALGGTNDDAVFAGTAGTVTLTSAITANDLTFNTTGYILSGAQTLTLNGTSPTLTTGSGIAATVSSVIGGSAGLTKAGAGTLTLSGANTYTGTTSISGGTLKVTGGLGATPSTYTGGITFNGTGTFNTNEAGGSNQKMGALTFSAGEGMVLNTFTSTGTTLTIDSMNTRAVGATANFNISGGTNGTTNKIVLSTTTNAPLRTTGSNNAGIFFGTTYDYARYDATVGTFKATTYGTDNNAPGAIVGGATFGINDATKDLMISNAITAQTTASVNTLRLTQAVTMASNAVLSANGILLAGNTGRTLGSSGVTSYLQPTTSGGELVLASGGTTAALAIYSIIQDNGGSPTNVTTGGPSVTTLQSANTYTGVTTINNGTLRAIGGLANINTASAIGKGSSGGSAADLLINGGTLQYNSNTATSTNRLFTIGVAGATLDASGSSGTGTLNIGSAGGNIAFTSSTNPASLTLTGTGSGATGTGTLTAVLGDSGTGTNITSLTKTSTGTWILAGANTHSGVTTITGGSLQLGNNSALQNSIFDPSGAGSLTFSSGINTPTFGGITSATNLTLASNVTGLTLNPGTGVTATYSGALGSVTAGMTLTKTGSGTQILNNTNTYSGDTTVKAGTLALGSSGSFSSSTVITVGDAGSSGAQLDLTAKSSGFTLASTQTLKGIGTVVTNTGAGQLTNNGILAPGNSIGTLNITGDYSFGSSSVYQVETNATTSDKIAISGAASIISGAAISFTGSTGLGNYVLATAASGLGSGSFSGAAPTGYTLKYSATELDLQHKATIALALGSNPANVHTGSQTVNLTIGNTAPTGSADLSYTLGGISGSAGTRAPGASSNATGTYTAVAGANSFDITASDSNASNSPQTVAFSQTGYALASTGFSTTSVALGTIHLGGTFGTTALSINNTLTSGTYNETLGAALANASGVSSSGSPITIAAGAAANTGLSIGLTSTSAGSHSGTVDVLFNSQAVNGSGLGTTALTALNKTITVTGAVFDGTGTWSGAASDWGSASHWSDANGVHAAPGTFAGYDNVDAANFSGGGATTVNLNGMSPSLKSLSLSGSNAYTLAQGNIGSASLQFNSDSGNASITAASTGHLISAPVILASNTTVAVTHPTDSLVVSGAISGLGLTKDGAGTLVLSGTNSYTGLTTVNGGSLLVNGSIVGGVSVSHTATLGGSGSITGALGMSGTLETGGASAIGRLIASGGTTFTSGSTFVYDMDSTTLNADMLVTGGLSLVGTVNLSLRDLESGTYAANTTFSLIQYTGELSGGFFTYNGTPLTGGNTGLAGTSWRIVYGDSLAGSNFTDPLVGGEKFINLTNASLTAIPEPGTLLALGCLVGSGLCLRSRRRDRSGGLPAGLGGL
ncbi:MAG: autotransporter-associated beta strand repeat-containing protein [Verrucomicrobiota bacterium]